jgi:hypothetical protein
MFILLILKAKSVDIANSVLNTGIFQNLVANVASFARDQVLLDETILTLVPVFYKVCCSDQSIEASKRIEKVAVEKAAEALSEAIELLKTWGNIKRFSELHEEIK